MDRYKKLSDYAAGPRNAIRVGGEIDTWCARCKMSLTHTILAMEEGEPAQVMCRTCKGVHKVHRQAASERAAPLRRGPSTPQARHAPRIWEEASRGKDLRNPVPYDPHRTFVVGEVILHGAFGVGIVVGLKDGGKMIVAFPDDTRLLVHGR